MTSGRVVEALGGVYSVATSSGVVKASLRGRLKRSGRAEDRVVVGDRVALKSGSGGCVIEAVHARRTTLARRAADGRRVKVMAANLDRLLVVASLADPSPSRDVIDRMMVMGEWGRLEVRLILTKIDLPGTAEPARVLGALYGEAGYLATTTSVVTGEGMEAFRQVVRKGASALVGPSGVGKSSLLNWVEPGLALRTLTVGKRSRAGRHATVSSRLVALARGGHVIDLPGFTAVGPGCVGPGELDRCFAEFRPFLDGCAFRDCTHVHEPDCAVLRALHDGRIQPERHRSYRAILEELPA